MAGTRTAPRTTDGARRRRRAIVALLDVDDELLARVPSDERPTARCRLVAPLELVPAGRGWPPPAPQPTWLAFQILDGVLVREEPVGARWSVELLGAGDVLRPWEQDGPLAPERQRETVWTALEPVRLAIVDRRLLSAADAIGVSDLLVSRLHRRVVTAAVQAGINALPRLEDRLVLTLWRLAERWGCVRPEGIEIPLGLTHSLLAHLVGAERTSVSAALSRLDVMGLVWRDARRCWFIDLQTPDRVGGLLAGGAERRRP